RFRPPGGARGGRRHLNEAIRLDDGFALAYHERGMAHALQGENDRALADCNQVIALGTYGKEDGAPPGEYRVTVQWFSRRDRKDARRLPDNVLPAKHARAETSDLAMRIQAEKNELPALRLTRGAKR